MSKLFEVTVYPWSSGLVGGLLSADFLVTVEGELFVQSIRQHATMKLSRSEDESSLCLQASLQQFPLAA